MKKCIFFCFLLILVSFGLFAQQDIDVTGLWHRDDNLIRELYHVKGGIMMETEERSYFYKRIGENEYQMDWTDTEYGIRYRWTMTVISGTLFRNVHELEGGSNKFARYYRKYIM